MIAVSEGKNKMAFSVCLCQENSKVIGLAPTMKEEGGVQIIAKFIT